jgi:hypothetical protein
MAALDNTLADLLQKQKTQVQETSQFMGSLTTSFPMAFAAAFKLWSLPDGGNPFPFAAGSCRAFQCFFAAAVLAADNGLMGYQGDRSEQTGAAMQTVADGYTQIAAEAQAALPMHS